MNFQIPDWVIVIVTVFLGFYEFKRWRETKKSYNLFLFIVVVLLFLLALMVTLGLIKTPIHLFG